MTPQKLGEVMDTLYSTFGKFKSLSEEVVSLPHDGFDFLMKFENTDRVMRIMFDKEEKVKSF
jgi:hypothetical protein